MDLVVVMVVVVRMRGYGVVDLVVFSWSGVEKSFRKASCSPIDPND